MTPPPVPRPPRDAQLLERVRLDGLAVRRRRHDHGWSPRDLVSAIEEAAFVASGLRKTLTPNQIQAIEERGELVSYEELLLLADGLACDPSDLMSDATTSRLRSETRGGYPDRGDAPLRGGSGAADDPRAHDEGDVARSRRRLH